MATNGGTIKFNVGFNVDKSSLNQITKSLQEVQRAASSNKDMNLDTQFKQAASAAKQLQQIINSSWNDKLNQLNLDKFNQSINQSFGSVQNLKNQLVSGTAQGQAAFNSLASAVLNTNVQLRQSNTLLDKMAVSMANTVKWGITSKIFNSITGSIRSAYYYAKDLNSSLTDIRMVTGDSADEMERFAKNANEVSKALGRSTLDYTKSAVEYYRQGLSDEQVAKRTEITLKAQNITGAGKEMVDYLTAVWNGFKINTEQAEKAVDSLAKVADSSASNMSELATAMSKVSATANVVGVDFNQLNAMIATVVATTRLAPESVGTAFKTVFARINDIKTGAEDAQISLGNYSGRMASLGINVLDTAGRLRDTGDVITQVGQKWKTLTKQQQTYLASTMGGQRQITQVMALFDNWDKYVDLLNVSLEANGTLNEKNNIYLESTAAHLQQLSTEAQRTYATLFDADALNGFVDGLQGVLSLFNDFIEGLGGGINTITYFGSVFAGIFSKQIAQAIIGVETRIKNLFISLNTDKFKQQYAAQVASKSGIDYYQTDKMSVQNDAIITRARQQAQIYTETLKARQGLTQQQQKQLTLAQEQVGKLTEQKYLLQHIQDIRQQYGVADLTDLQALEQREQSLKEQDITQSKILSTLSQIQILNKRAVLQEQDETNLRKQLNVLYEQGLIDINQYNVLLERQQGSENIINSLIEKQSLKYRDIHGQLQQITSLKELQEKLDNGELQIIDGQLVATKRLVEGFKQTGQHAVKVRNVVKGMAAAGQAFTALAGALPTLMDDTATGAQKANAAFSGLQGTIMAVGTMFGPIGMGVSTLINGALSLVKSIFGDQIERWFMSAEDKINELAEKTKKANQEVATSNKNISSLQELKEQWSELSNAAGKYGRNLKTMTQEQQSRYHQIVDQMIKYNEDIVVGYDAQGQAIIRNNDQLEKTIELLKEQKRVAVQQSLGDINQIFEAENLRVSAPFAEKSDRQQAVEKAQEQLDKVKNLVKSYEEQDRYLKDAADSFQSSLSILLGSDSFLLTKEGQEVFGSDYELRGFQLEDWLRNQLGWGQDEDISTIVDQFINSFKENEDGILEATDATQSYFDKIAQLYNFIKQQSESTLVSTYFVNGVNPFENIAASGGLMSEILGYFSDGVSQDIEQAQLTLQDAQEKLKQSQQAIAEGMHFDTSVLAQVLQNYEGYRKQWSILTEDIGADQSVIRDLMLAFMDQFTLSENGKNDIENHKAVNAQAVINYTRQYLKDLGGIFTQVYEQTQKEIEKTDFTNFEGTASQKTNKIASIIENVFSNLKTDLIDSEQEKQTIVDLLKELFNLDILELDEEGNVSNLQEKADAYVLDAQKIVSEKLKELGYSLSDIAKESVTVGFSPDGVAQQIIQYVQSLPLDELKDIFTQGELLDIDNVLAAIGQGLAQGAEDGQDYITVLTNCLGLWRDANKVLEESKDLDFDTIFSGFDDLTEKLKEGKELKEEEESYLQTLEQENQVLKNLALTKGRGSEDYLIQLAKQEKIGHELYIQQQKNNIEALKTQISQTDVEQDILNYQNLIIEATYNLNRAEAAVNQQLEERKQLQQDILDLKQKQIKDDVQNIENLGTAIEHWKDSTEKLTSSDIASVTTLVKRSQDEQLVNLFGQNGQGINDPAFWDRVEQIYTQNGQNMLNEAYNDLIQFEKQKLTEKTEALAKAQDDNNAKIEQLAKKRLAQQYGSWQTWNRLSEDQQKEEWWLAVTWAMQQVTQESKALAAAEADVQDQTIALTEAQANQTNASAQQAAKAQQDAQALEKQAQALEKVRNAADGAAQSVWKMQQSQLTDQHSQTGSRIKQLQGIKDTIGRLKDSSKDVTSGDYSIIEFLKGQFPQLAALATTEADIFGDAFISQLQTIAGSGQFDSLLSTLYDTSIAETQAIAESLKIRANETAQDLQDIFASNKEKFNGVSYLTSADVDKALQQAEAASGTKDYETKLQYAQDMEAALQAQTKAQENARQAQQDYKEAVDAVTEAYYAQAQAARQAAQEEQNLLEIFKSLTNRQDLSQEEQIQLSNLLDKLTGTYSELTAAAAILNDTWLVGTQAYNQALKQVEDKLEQIKYQELQEKLSDLYINIDLENLDDCMDEIEDFLDVEREIIIAVHTDAENEFDRLQAQMDRIYDASSKIGENFVVAADDVRQLNNVFPGILAGMQDLHDGTVRLSQDAVQQAIAGAAQVVEADAQSVNQQLQSQANLLHAKAANYRSAAQAAALLANSEQLSQEEASQARQTIVNGLMMAKTDMQAQAATDIADTSAQAAQAQMTNMSEIGDSSNQNAGVVAQNFAGASASAAQSIATLANNAIANFAAIANASRAAANGQAVSGGAVGGYSYSYSYGGQGGINKSATRKSISSSYSGGTTYSDSYGTIGADGLYHRYSDQKIIEDSGKDYAALEAMFNDLALLAETAATDIEGMIVQGALDLTKLGNEMANAAAGRPSSGSGGGGGGGGGGQPDIMQGLEEEADRYHDIDIQLKRIANDLEKVQQLQEKLVGQKLIDNLQEQYQLLEDQVSAYKHKVELAQQERAQIGLTLAAQGVTFDKNGAISNYAEALMGQESLVNEIITHYNYMSADQQQAYKDVVEQAKQQYEDFKAQIERYDQLTFEMIPELEKSIREERDKQIELQITKFTMKVQLELELAKAERDFNKFRKKVIKQLRDDNFLALGQANLVDLMTYYGSGQNVVSTLTDQVNATLEQLRQIKQTGTSEIYGQNEARALEDLKKYTDQLMSNMEQAEDIVNDIKDSIFDAIDAAKDAFDEQVDDYKYLSKLLDHDVKLIKLLYGDDAYDSLNTYYQMQEENNNKQLDFLRQEKELWYQSMMIEKQRMDNLDEGSNDFKEAEERFKAYKKNWQDSVEELNSLVESSVETIIEKYSNAITSIFDQLNRKLSGGKSLDYVKEEWELINKRADLYLDKVNSLYEIEKLRDKYQQAINDYDGNLKAQQSLRDTMEEQLKFLQDKDKLTKYDVDRANALLQIELKRFALQDARKNKTKLRLRRDSQGNYTYQYTADEDSMKNAERDLRDAQNDLYNLTKQAYKDTLGDFYDYINEWETKVQQVYKDTTLTVDEQQEKIAFLNEYYGDIINSLTQQNEQLKQYMFEDTYNSLYDLYDQNLIRYSNMTQEEKDAAQREFDAFAEMYGLDKDRFADMIDYEKWLVMENMVPYWQSAMQTMINSFSGEGGFIPTTESSFYELKTITENYQTSLYNLATAAGIDFDKIKQGINDTDVKMKNLIQDNNTLVKKYQDELTDIDNLITKLGDLTKAYGDVKDAAIKAAEESKKYWEAEKKAAAQAADRAAMQAQQTTYTDNPSTYTPASAPASSGSDTNGTGGTGGSLGNTGSWLTSGWGNVTTYYYLARTWDQRGTNNNYSGWLTASGLNALNTKSWKAANGKVSVVKSKSASLSGQVDQKWFYPGYVTAWDTGGYTGNWTGNDGKLAVLHRKELILNATDTQNILTAVDIVRDINNLLSGISAGSGLSGLVAGAGASSSLDQNVYITAEFPNVTQHTQIEKAFETLVNQASQFAFNTRK